MQMHLINLDYVGVYLSENVCKLAKLLVVD